MGDVINLNDKQILSEKDDEGRITPLGLIDELKEILAEQDDLVVVMRTDEGNLALAHNSMKIEDIYWLLSCAKQTLIE